jgi:hypothetical protein
MPILMNLFPPLNKENSIAVESLQSLELELKS